MPKARKADERHEPELREGTEREKLARLDEMFGNVISVSNKAVQARIAKVKEKRARAKKRKAR